MAIDYPPVFINRYLAETITNGFPDYFSQTMKFFPTQPSSIDELTEQFPEASADVFAVYDRMFRMRRGPFPHIRTEQILYYFYKTAEDIEPLIETIQSVSDILDNGDESAEDINAWIKGLHDSQGGVYENGRPVVGFGDQGKTFYMPYFHDFKIYQLEEARDIVDFGTARTYAGNKVIIEYTWHKTN